MSDKTIITILLILAISMIVISVLSYLAGLQAGLMAEKLDEESEDTE
jgi:uncharacterized protein involved in cysteine biosynthesis